MTRKSEQIANHEYPVLLSAGGKNSRGKALAHQWSEAEKKKRAFRGLGIAWGLAVISIALPLAHFILVPGFLLAGPFAFFWIRKQEGTIIGLVAQCPFCEKALTGCRAGIEWPLRIVCAHCSEPVRIDRELQG